MRKPFLLLLLVITIPQVSFEQINPTKEEQRLSCSTPNSDFVSTIYEHSLYFVKEVPRNGSSCDEKLQLVAIDLNSGDPVKTGNWGGKIGQLSFSRARDGVYYTECECEDNKYTCKIYYQDIDSEKKPIGSPYLLPDSINLDGYTSTQPQVGIDPESGRECLYFVTDRESENNMDIWIAMLDFSEPHQPRVSHCSKVAGINTCYDEMTPYFHEKTNKLYFSSNRPKDSGAVDYDIYSYLYQDRDQHPCLQDQEKLDSVILENRPLNSAQDDLYFRMNEPGNKAWFSSDRPGPDSCVGGCLDIFELEMVVPVPDTLRSIWVQVGCSDQKSSNQQEINFCQIFTDAEVHLEDKAGNKYIHTPAAASNPPDYYRFDNLDLNKIYRVVAVKANYSGAETPYFAPHICRDSIRTIKVSLAPQIILKVNTVDEKLKEIGIPAQVDAGPVSIVPEGKESIPMVQVATGEYEASLAPCTTYEIKIRGKVSTALGFSLTLDTSDQSFSISPDGCSPDTISRTYLFKIPVNDLPLYFDEDIPKRNTVLPYDSLYKNFILDERKKEFYSCDDSTRSFFSTVESNMEAMQNFAKYLEYYLERLDINSVCLNIWGFASATGGSKYNLQLSERRIESVEKFIRNSIHLNQDQFYLHVIPTQRGNTMAQKNIDSDCPYSNEKKGKRLSKAASLDRRIQLKDFKFNTYDCNTLEE